MALSEVDLSHIRNGRTKPAICTTHGAFTDTGVMIRDRIIWMGCAQCALEARDRENARLAKEATKRSEAVKATIVISNLSGEALMDYLGEAAMDRLREGGRSVLFDWTSYRRRGY